ncbi:polysaccharide deacetylase family protein [Kitasatospora sp. NPDC004240]
MTADRRTLLRTTAKLAALTVTGGLLAACGDSGNRRADDPDLSVRDGGPGGGEPAWPGHEGPASPAPATPAGGTAGESPSGPPAPSTPPSPPVLPPLPPGVPAEVVNGPRAAKAVALTFHGAGDPELATAVLRTAEQRGAGLTVLAVGSWLDQQPQMARRILDGGHELGNHTQNHRDLGALTPEQVRAEIAQCAERLQRLTGSIGRWFRPSAAQYATPVVREQARAVGYPYVLSFDVDPRDYGDPSAAELRRRVLGSVRGGSVVALHLGHRCTVDALPGILDGLDRAGLRAVTASRLFT